MVKPQGELCFKSPRECYKPHRTSALCRMSYKVSSPQGNATNVTLEYKTWSVPLGHGLFQVPKGMLQTRELSLSLSESLSFQVPKGMLQTVRKRIHDHDLFAMFQVPKGMLQTQLFELKILENLLVSSPQRNATNYYSPVF